MKAPTGWRQGAAEVELAVGNDALPPGIGLRPETSVLGSLDIPRAHEMTRVPQLLHHTRRKKLTLAAN